MVYKSQLHEGDLMKYLKRFAKMDFIYNIYL